MAGAAVRRDSRNCLPRQSDNQKSRPSRHSPAARSGVSQELAVRVCAYSTTFGKSSCVTSNLSADRESGKSRSVWSQGSCAVVESCGFGRTSSDRCRHSGLDQTRCSSLTCFSRTGLFPVSSAGQCRMRVLDLFTEFRNLTNGWPTIAGNSLLGALAHFGLDGIGVEEKEEMRQRILRGGPWLPGEPQAILDYCETDVAALSRLLPAMVPRLDLGRALLARALHVGGSCDGVLRRAGQHGTSEPNNRRLGHNSGPAHCPDQPGLSSLRRPHFQARPVRTIFGPEQISRGPG